MNLEDEFNALLAETLSHAMERERTAWQKLTAPGQESLVLFGAGDEKQTSPFNSDHRIVWRLGRLSCEPCQKNTCKFGTPKCLAELDETALVTLFLPLVR